MAHVEKLLGVENLYDPANMDVLHHVNQAPARPHPLPARRRLRGQGRPGHHRRRVHRPPDAGPALVATACTRRSRPRRGVKIERENQTLATITFQNYFRMYKKLAGMTGTAETEAAEFDKIYKLDVLVIPTNRPLIRDRPPRRRLPDRAREVRRGGRARSRSCTPAGPARCWSGTHLDREVRAALAAAQERARHQARRC